MKNLLTRVKFLFYSVQSIFIKSSKINMKNGLSFNLETKNMHETHRANTFFSKEPEMIEWINKLSQINNGDKFIFYDVGANIGIYSLYTAVLHKNSIVYSFEPEATNFSSLCCNIVNNHLENIIPFQLALSNVDNFDLLHVGIVKSGAGAAAVGKDYAFIEKSSSFKQGIYCVSLNSIYENTFFQKPNFIKIDVDGHESKILEKADKIFRDPILKGIIIEFEYANVEEMNIFISRICSYGFILVLKSDWIEVNLPGKTSIRNFLFERNK